MSDLDTAIRERLDGWLDEICGYWRKGCPVEGHEEPTKMRAALLAVLGLHRAVPAEDIDWSSCVICHGAHPCATLRAIAEKLGVDHD